MAVPSSAVLSEAIERVRAVAGDRTSGTATSAAIPLAWSVPGHSVWSSDRLGLGRAALAQVDAEHQEHSN